MRILITGAAGFIGARLAKALLSDPATRKSEFFFCDDLSALNSRDCAKGLSDRAAGICAPEQLWNHMAQWKPTVVFHIGACSSTTETNQNYLRSNNIEYSQKLWTWCTQNRAQFYYASSASTYGNGEHGYSDNDSLTPQLKALNLYGWSKLEFDQWVLQQSNQPIHWAGFRYFNVYGPGEHHKRDQASMVHKSFFQIRESQGKVRLFRSHREGFSDGGQLRDFVFVDDVVSVMRYFMDHLNAPSGIYNVGTGKARSFLDLSLAVGRAMNIPITVEYFDMPENIRSHYQYFTEADLNKLRQAGYQTPFHPLEDGVKKTVRELQQAAQSEN